ncbi:acetyl-CoA carboxylase biotin carboxyl carrier protein [Paractinoplanes toevensis]|uniref:Biotin carboxyl carrier protein of acetyl-CoA carboxylase n=1 Tax=Paractinoplanes toevensis TaxID=571911 RepID=A0A919TCL1_9ACTN|nr:biotin/lipoyl-containing protein [Actinoplanes toevensis]GIM92607.1 hypothetical protein Ato02nite_044000 [Actinoplanes toevensis]
MEPLAELGKIAEMVVDRLPPGVTRLSVRSGDCQIDVDWEPGQSRPESVVTPAAPAEPAPAQTGLSTLKAPMVGTFYARPEPDAAPFVSPGDRVKAGTQVALIEAMKLFAPVAAPADCEIVAIHPADGDMVEYDEVLMDFVTLEG